MRTTPDSPTLRRPGLSALLLLFFVSGGCAGGGGGAHVAPSATRTPENLWEALREPRPEPLPDAPRVTVSEILLLDDPWGLETPIPTALGIQELVSAGLLRRRDVEFVERRRFSHAAELERQGRPRPRGAPPVGTSPGAEMALAGSWAPSGPDSAYLDCRLTDPETGRVLYTFRQATTPSADPTALARSITAGILRTLEEAGRLPTWSDPLPGTTPERFSPSRVGLVAVAAFFRGVAAEDRYNWEGARAGYQEALDLTGAEFPEARAALARVARLRAGGTLGEG